MSYLKCPNCDEKITVFGESHLEEFSKEANFDILGQLPIVSKNTKYVDEGNVELINLPEISSVIDIITKEE
jgi:hypothetical protein